MNPPHPNPTAGSIGAPAKIGAWLFVLWGILHIWVGAEGVRQYLTAGTPGLWNIVLGGSAMPREAFAHATDAATLFAQGQLLLNFCIDVGGYGVLGLIVALMILRQGSWVGYFIGVVAIGIADLTFLLAMVVPGVIELNVGTVSGPLLWFAAIILTPLGLPKAAHA